MIEIVKENKFQRRRFIKYKNHSEVCERFHKCLKCNKILKRGDKMVDEGKKMIEEGNRLICTKPKMIQKCNKMIEEGSEEYKCGWEKCRNCYKEVEIRKHRCYMQWKRQKGGICQTKIKDGGEEQSKYYLF
ncbi:hypothetical protein Zmor_026269 [Zophobas morio]|uniref:Uncharacterized protein n=1 Tax=Zophobas morio TaxID=2755281 RepID=A0AA38M5V0_9CUCU|nr:hypothetical protein Zmor_026269 [Zophobas morio]